MKWTKLYKKILVPALFTIMGLSVISCGASSDIANGYDTSSSLIASTERDESDTAAEDAFEEAALDFTNTISQLRNDLEDANLLLQSVTCDMVMDADVLERLDTISKQAEAHLNDQIPDRGNNAEDIYQQIQEMDKQINMLRDINEDLLFYMSETEESKQLFEESNKSEIIMVDFECNVGQYDISVYSVNPENGQQNMIQTGKPMKQRPQIVEGYI